MKKTLVLITQSYPYEIAWEHTFLDAEMHYLSSAFDRIIIIPERLDGNRRALPGNAELDASHSKNIQGGSGNKNPTRRVLHSKLFWEELISNPTLFTKRRNLKWLFRTVVRANCAQKSFEEIILRYKLDWSNTLFYTYWFWNAALGLALLKNKHPEIRLVSRAHGFDLYETRHSPEHIIGRSLCIKQFSKLFTVSEHGQKYIQARYPKFSDRCQTARLGTKDPGFLTFRSADGVYRIVSCSFINPVKRIDLLLAGINCLALAAPGDSFEWHHIGNGPDLNSLIEMTANFPSNSKSRFHGGLSNEDVYKFYKEHAVDVFVNVSQTEGIPVSIMEAQSCGIPVVATAVGGTPEIVKQDNGCLLTPDPTPMEIAMKIRDTIFSDGHELKRKASRDTWLLSYSADRNFRDFAEQLSSLL